MIYHTKCPECEIDVCFTITPGRAPKPGTISSMSHDDPAFSDPGWRDEVEPYGPPSFLKTYPVCPNPFCSHEFTESGVIDDWRFEEGLDD